MTTDAAKEGAAATTLESRDGDSARLPDCLVADGAAARSALLEEAVRKEEARLAQRCEDIMARENDSWRAEWISEESAQRTGAFQQLKETASNSGGRIS